MSAVKRYCRRIVTEASSNHQSVCIFRRVRARDLLRLNRSGSRVSTFASGREDAMCNARCTEPSLNELFCDVAMQLLMRRDGVTERDVRALLDGLRVVRSEKSGETATGRRAI